MGKKNAGPCDHQMDIELLENCTSCVYIYGFMPRWKEELNGGAVNAFINDRDEALEICLLNLLLRKRSGWR